MKMTKNPPIWKNGIVWTYSEHYKRYIANYTPWHYLHLAMVKKKGDVE